MFFDEELLAVLFLFVLAFCALFGFAFWMSSWECESRWEKSGFHTDYGPMQGCLIRLDDGRWIPEERYREIDQ